MYNGFFLIRKYKPISLYKYNTQGWLQIVANTIYHKNV